MILHSTKFATVINTYSKSHILVCHLIYHTSDTSSILMGLPDLGHDSQLNIWCFFFVVVDSVVLVVFFKRKL